MTVGRSLLSRSDDPRTLVAGHAGADDDVEHGGSDGDDHDDDDRDAESPDPRNVRSHSAGAPRAQRVLPHLARCAASLPRVRGSKVTTRAAGQYLSAVSSRRASAAALVRFGRGAMTPRSGGDDELATP